MSACSRRSAIDRASHWTAADIDDLVARKAVRLEALERDVSVLFPGAADAIRRARRGRAAGDRIGRATASRFGACWNAKICLSHFAAIVPAEDTPLSKPAPDPYLRAVARLGAAVRRSARCRRLRGHRRFALGTRVGPRGRPADGCRDAHLSGLRAERGRARHRANRLVVVYLVPVRIACSRTSGCCPTRRSPRTSRSRCRSSASHAARSPRLVPETLELVGLEGKGHRMPDELSGGEQQRVAVARAFVNRPMILIADEPTGNLDPATSVGIMKLLDRINRTDTTVVMATHDSTIVDQMRKRVIELDDGHVVRDEARGIYGYQN